MTLTQGEVEPNETDIAVDSIIADITVVAKRTSEPDEAQLTGRRGQTLIAVGDG